MSRLGESLGVILESDHYVSFITTDIFHVGSRGLGSSILRSFTMSDANRYFTSASAEFQAYLDLDHHDHAAKRVQATRDLVAHRIKYCLFEKGPNPVDTEKREDTDTLMTTEADYSYAGEDEHLVNPRKALEKLLEVMHNVVVWRAG